LLLLAWLVGYTVHVVHGAHHATDTRLSQDKTISADDLDQVSLPRCTICWQQSQHCTYRRGQAAFCQGPHCSCFASRFEFLLISRLPLSARVCLTRSAADSYSMHMGRSRNTGLPRTSPSAAACKQIQLHLCLQTCCPSLTKQARSCTIAWLTPAQLTWINAATAFPCRLQLHTLSQHSLPCGRGMKDAAAHIVTHARVVQSQSCTFWTC
jgi:hypothetical protein